MSNSLRKYISLPSVALLFYVCTRAYYVWERNWDIYSDRPEMAVRDVISHSYRQYFARKYINFNTQQIINATYNGSSPIINKLVYDYRFEQNDKHEILRLIRLFVNNNANINSTWNGKTALNQAITLNQPELVAELLKLGADSNIAGRSEVSYCSSSRALEFAMCLHNVDDRSEIIAILLDNDA